MKTCIVGLLLWGSCLSVACAQSAVPLVVGSVRDQGGQAVADALVRAFDAAGMPLTSARTAADGTFALPTAGAATVRIECDFCVSRTLPVAAAQPLTAVVHRFTSVMAPGPSASDVAALPYAHVESLLSLEPFVVLSDSDSILPGPSVSDRGLSAGGGVVLDGGIPVYDIAANVSPFLSVPSRNAQSVSENDVATGFRYGDRADAGIAAFDTQGRSGGFAGVGGDDIFGAHFGGFPANGGTYASYNPIESRQRLDGDFGSRLADGSFDARLVSERGALWPGSGDALTSSFSGLRLSFDRVRAQRTYAQLVLDRGTYAATLASNAIGAYWSDVSVQAGVESTSKDPVFFEASVRRSNGEYASGALLPPIAASLTQKQLSTGVSMHGSSSDLLAGVSLVDVAFGGGVQPLGYGSNTIGAATSLITPSIDFRWHDAGHWSFDSLAASTFRLPTFLQRYGTPPPSDVVSFDRNALLQETVGYTDLHRLRASLTAYRQQSHGLDQGVVAGTGASFSWALSSHLSVRSWFLRETDTRAATLPYISFSPFVPAAGVGSVWLTYENEDHVRADAIFRRDLIGGIGFNHLDGALLFPAGKHAHFFVGSEVRHRMRFTDLGIRFDRF